MNYWVILNAIGRSDSSQVGNNDIDDKVITIQVILMQALFMCIFIITGVLLGFFIFTIPIPRQNNPMRFILFVRGK
jgi:hypothetical protein